MKRIILVFLVLVIIPLAYSQSLMDIQNLKVDNLSDAQLEQLIKRAEASGLNEEQLQSVAIERGMPLSEAAKLRQRIDALKSRRSGPKSRLESNAGGILRSVEGRESEDDIFDSLRKSDPYYELSPIQKKIFGFTLFYNKKINFTPSLNIPTPPNYVLGPGDQLLIDVYGASQQSFDLKINPDGRILIPNVGSVQVGGSSVAAATSRIKSSLNQIYSGLSTGNTFLEVRLGNIKTVNVSLVGELNNPGTYTLPSFASPINALFAAGGLNENGSFRHIQIYRDNRLLQEVDIYNFISKGEFNSSLVLKDNDVIIVPPFKNRIEIIGPVRRDGLFELKSGESIEDLLRFAGGFGSDAYKDRITVSRKTGKDLKIEDVDRTSYGSFFPVDGDIIRIGKIQMKFENRIQISGAVQRPGSFSLSEGMGIKDLIAKADGIREDAFLNRATLYRTKTDFSLEILEIDIPSITNGNTPDILLKREDWLHIPSIYDLKEEYYVKISGEINNPGTFPFGENMKVGDLILRAGGFKESATSSRIEIARRIKNDVSGKLAEIIIIDITSDLKISGQNSQTILQPFDHIMVRRSPGFQRTQLVSVEGEAMYPGEFAIAHANERISDLLKRAGGLTNYAYPKGATLIRRNEFFKSPTEEDIKLSNLEELQKIMDRDSSEWTQAERILMKSIETKLLNKQKEMTEKSGFKGNSEDTQSEDLKKENLMLLADTDENIKPLKIKDVELIGIDLNEILANPYGPFDLILKEGDVLSIPKELQTVRMRGEVLFPTTARFENFRGFRSYISKSGGFTDKARKGRSYVVYANGDVKRTEKFLFFNSYPKIEPGAEIIVPSKPERERLSPQAWIGIASSLATLALIVNQLVQ
ncbi:MAG: SLBB domain-containing protein [Algoriphagus sp.]|nr:SLBB domain-containing protein [Algoriphagus sp.]